MIIFRYLTRETYVTTLAVTGILLIIFISNQFVRYLGDAAIGRLTAQAVLQMMSIQVPLLLGLMLPLGLFLGILLSHGRLYVDNEMTILFACGVSRGQILSMSFFFAAFVSVIVALLMLWLEPKMAEYRDQIIAKAAVSSPLDKIIPGRFQKVGDDWVLFVEKITKNRREMRNVFAAMIPNSQEVKKRFDVVYAEKAYQKIDSRTHAVFVVLGNGFRYVGRPGNNNYQIIKFAEYGIRIKSVTPSLEKLEEFMTTSELWRKRNTNILAAAELQWRIAMPISVLILAFFASFMSEVKPRQGRYAKLVPAILFYIMYINFIFMAEAWIRKGRISPAIGMWWIHLLMLMIALVAYRYKKRRV